MWRLIQLKTISKISYTSTNKGNSYYLHSLLMDRSYWLVNSNRSRVKRFIENTNNKDQFFKYMFIDSGEVNSTWGKETHVMTTREELKREAAREARKNLIAQGWRRTEKVLQKTN